MAEVMVVDDEDVLVEIIATLIEELGHQAVTATNGQEALRMLRDRRFPPALIISDVMMPRMDGIELARTIKATPHLRRVPVILMSAAGKPPGDHIADGFMHKPFELDTLVRIIEHYVDGV